MKKNNGRNKDCNMQIEETIQASLRSLHKHITTDSAYRSL